MGSNILSDHYFHNGTTVTGNGEEMNVQNFSDTLEVEMMTDGTATIYFEGEGKLGVWRPLLGTKLTSPLSMMTSVAITSAVEPFYQFDVSGINKARMRVSATSGDPLYIYGKILG